MPNCRALRVNSFTSARPTAISTVSTAKVFSVPGDDAPAGVERGDGGRLHVVAARGADDGVAGEDRDPEPHELVRVDLVAADLGQRLDQGRHLDAGLDGVVAGDQADVAAADDEDPLGGLHQVAVDQGLEGAGPINSGQRVAGEGEHFFAGAGRDHQLGGCDRDVAPAAHEADDPVREHRHGGGVQPDLYRRVAGRFRPRGCSRSRSRGCRHRNPPRTRRTCGSAGRACRPGGPCRRPPGWRHRACRARSPPTGRPGRRR